MHALPMHVAMVLNVQLRETQSTVSATPPFLMWKLQRSVQAYWGLSSSSWLLCVSENTTSAARSTSPAACRIPTATSQRCLKTWWKQLRSALLWRSAHWLAPQVIWLTAHFVPSNLVNRGSSALRWALGPRVLWFAAWPLIYLLHPPPALITTLLEKTTGSTTTKVSTWVLFIIFPASTGTSLHLEFSHIIKDESGEGQIAACAPAGQWKSMCGSYSITSSVCSGTEHFLMCASV